MTNVEVIGMPADAPPAPVQVIEVQASFSGLSAEQAGRDDFQSSFEQAVADQLHVDPLQVQVTSVQVNDGGDVVLVYVVKDIAPEDMQNTQQALESRDIAEAIGDQLEEGKGNDHLWFVLHLTSVSYSSLCLPLSPSFSFICLLTRQVVTMEWTLDPRRPAKPPCRSQSCPS